MMVKFCDQVWFSGSDAVTVPFIGPALVWQLMLAVAELMVEQPSTVPETSTSMAAVSLSTTVVVTL